MLKVGSSTIPGQCGKKKAIAYSGSTKPMFHERTQFTTYEPTNKHFFRIVNGSIQKVLGIDNVGHSVNVLYIPSLVFDLVSEPELDQSGI